ncbi:UxaA family hydrolase [Falsiroseomonas selenitidurans]|uniref:Altronate dehydratase n=1 Tax=Falsiroseomonas selenitidurans TaxID=2716335 RepID=A0ABX1DXB2_9PROT|nr:altronate dehydratase family protein [Falsiroseomonas selenitidurans]NKC29416.1 altronate dehydratase [Falsiroseomonas selenitidurans]
MIDLKAKRLNGPVIRLHPDDNVVVARIDIEPGTSIPGENMLARQKVPAGYKITTTSLRKGDPVLKYQVTIGFAAEDLPAGTMVHTHNIDFREFDRDYAIGRDYRPVEMIPDDQRKTFEGYVRADGRVGTRNFIAVVSSVNCSATVSHAVADWFTPDRMAEWPNVDGVAAFTHSTGCGMELSGEPMQLLRRTLGGYMRHPNVAGVVVIGLGCERNQIAGLLAEQGLAPGPMLKSLVMQEVGGTRKSIDAGVAAVREMMAEANKASRTTVSAAHLSVGLQCGGSDGFSSITANPALGAAMDLLVRHGGTAILSETPEIYGVEHTLTRRAASQEVGEKLIERIRWWKDVYTPGRDTQINGVVSPGNQAGGLANILEKSLGSSMKGGTGPLMDVFRYAEPITTKGFVFMDTPGFDPVSATGQVAGGANMIAFTTGRGSMYGAKPVPSVKLATNTPMFRRLEEDMDINCGEILDGTASLAEMGERILDLLLRTASGAPTKSELLGVGKHEFAPWQIGITG